MRRTRIWFSAIFSFIFFFGFCEAPGFRVNALEKGKVKGAPGKENFFDAKKFPPDRFRCATGSASLKEKDYKKLARDRALEKLSSQIATKVTVEKYSKRVNNKSWVQNTARSENVVKELRYLREVEKSGQEDYHNIQCLEIKPFVESYEKESAKVYRKAEDGMRESLKSLEENNIQDSLRYFENAYVDFLEAEKKQWLAEIVALPGGINVRKPGYEINYFWTFIKIFNSAIKIKQSPDHTLGIADRGVPQERLQVTVVNIYGEKRLGVKNLPFEISYKNGELDLESKNIRTDEKGTAGIEVRRVKYTGNHQEIPVEFTVDFNSYFKNPALFSDFNLRRIIEFRFKKLIYPCDILESNYRHLLEDIYKEGGVKKGSIIIINDLFPELASSTGRFALEASEKIRSLSVNEYKMDVVKNDRLFEDENYYLLAFAYQKINDKIIIKGKLSKKLADRLAHTRDLAIEVPYRQLSECGYSFEEIISPRRTVVEYRPFSESLIKISIASSKGKYATYREGEKFRMVLETDQDSYLRIYNLAPNGKVHKLYPLIKGENGRVKARKRIFIPGAEEGEKKEIVVREPFGTDHVVAFASEKPFDELVISTIGNYQELINTMRNYYASLKNNKYGEAYIIVNTLKGD